MMINASLTSVTWISGGVGNEGNRPTDTIGTGYYMVSLALAGIYDWIIPYPRRIYDWIIPHARMIEPHEKWSWRSSFSHKPLHTNPPLRGPKP